jgi:CRISPR/Cas system-associated exonuclease Cas4 (RecB family)
MQQDIKLAHSYSSIKMFENCPKRYYHQRITKEVTDTGSDATRHGERIHADLEHRLINQKPLTYDTEQYEVLCQTIEVLATGGELHAERQLCLNENLTPTSWYANDAWLRSILDVLILKDDEAIVMDWKTGKRRPDFTQLQLFALQVFKHFPEIKSVKSSFVWLRHMEMDTEVFTVDKTNLMWADMLSRIERIQQSLDNDNWPAKPSGLCNWCPAKNICEYAKI